MLPQPRSSALLPVVLGTLAALLYAALQLVQLGYGAYFRYGFTSLRELPITTAEALVSSFASLLVGILVASLTVLFRRRLALGTSLIALLPALLFTFFSACIACDITLALALITSLGGASLIPFAEQFRFLSLILLLLATGFVSYRAASPATCTIRSKKLFNISKMP